MNYTELRQLIIDTTENDETSFTTHIPDFVRSAEQRIYLLMKLPAQRAEATVTGSIGAVDLTAPSGFLAADSVRVTSSGVSYPLIPKDPDFLKEAFPTSTQGLPRYYSVFNNTTIRVAPAPDAEYVYTVQYTKHPSSIVDASTSWLGDNMSSALLYGSLVEAYIYMKGEPDVLQMYQQLFAEAVGLTGRLAERDRTDEFRSNRTIPVT